MRRGGTYHDGQADEANVTAEIKVSYGERTRRAGRRAHTRAQTLWGSSRKRGRVVVEEKDRWDRER